MNSYLEVDMKFSDFPDKHLLIGDINITNLTKVYKDINDVAICKEFKSFLEVSPRRNECNIFKTLLLIFIISMLIPILALISVNIVNGLPISAVDKTIVFKILFIGLMCFNLTLAYINSKNLYLDRKEVKTYTKYKNDIKFLIQSSMLKLNIRIKDQYIKKIFIKTVFNLFLNKKLEGVLC